MTHGIIITITITIMVRIMADWTRIQALETRGTVKVHELLNTRSAEAVLLCTRESRAPARRGTTIKIWEHADVGTVTVLTVNATSKEDYPRITGL
mmetsp:Transcript_15586/g.27328  ORF Transcript_15586/g.27328 Transcript_15586/m.27328 type:complete len:95 (+) Transcript_15586:268-552(+)